MSIELKPCPFCGEEAILAETNDEVLVECCNCYAHTGLYCSEQEAIDAWNSRVKPTFTPDELDAIRKALEAYSPKSRKQWELGVSIIEKCAKALKGGNVE